MKRNVSKIISLIAAVLVLMSVFAGCGQTNNAPTDSKTTDNSTTQAASTTAAPAEKTKMVLMTLHPDGDPFKQNLQDCINEFNQTNTYNAEFSLESVLGADPYKTKIRADVAAGNAPDVFYWWVSDSKPFADSQKIVFFNDALNADQTWKDSFKPGMLDQASIDGNVIGIPSGTGLAFMYYNKEIFAKYNLEVPKTYEDFINVIKTLRSNNVDPIAVGAKDKWMVELIDQYLLIRTGAIKQYQQAFNDKKGLDVPAVLDVYKKLDELVKLNAFEKGTLSNDYTASENLFMNGQAGMRICYNNEIGVFNGDNSAVKGKFGIFAFPAVDESDNSEVWHGQLDQLLAASADSKNKDAAIAFIKLFTGPEYQQANVEKAGLIPTTNVQFDKSKLDPVTVQLLDTFSSAKGVETWPNYSATMGTELFNAAQAIVAGQAPDAVLKALESSLEKDQ